MERREFIGMAAGMGATALVGDGVWCAFGEDLAIVPESTAYSAWKEWNSAAGPRPLNLVRAAILAASPHNTQPWRFRVGETFVELYLETSRSVRGLDPYLREAYIGMGCALENLLLTAKADGCPARLTLVEGELSVRPVQPTLRLVGRVDLVAGTAQESELQMESELYRAIPNRHTNRSPYHPTQTLPSTFPAELMSVCRLDDEVRLFLFDQREQREELVRISAAANLELYSEDAVESGSEEWIRWRSSDVQKFKDGLTIDNFGLSPLATALAKLAPVSMLKRAASPEHRSSLYAGQMQSAPLTGLVAVRDRLDTRQNLLAGRVWQRAHLLATGRGIGARPCNEAIEMIDRERFHMKAPERQSQLGRVIGDPSWQPTFLFLMGYPTQAAHLSPRRPVEMAELS